MPVRRVRLPDHVARAVEVSAGGLRARGAWLRALWHRQSDGRRRAVAVGTTEIKVRLSADELARIEAAAARSGMPTEQWMREAVMLEIG